MKIMYLSYSVKYKKLKLKYIVITEILDYTNLIYMVLYWFHNIFKI